MESASHRTRSLRFRKTIVASVATTLLMTGGVGQAVACNTVATGAWANNCLIGYGYDTAAMYIVGTQRILKQLSFYGGSIDGYWGPLSHGATINYQSSEGLSADGVVGSQTWNALAGEIGNCGQTGRYIYYHGPGETCGTASFRLDTQPYYYWFVKRVNPTWQVSFSVHGPY